MKNIFNLEECKKYFSILGYVGICYLSIIILTFQRRNLGIVLLAIGSIPFLKNYKLDKNQKLLLLFLLLVPLFQYFNLDEREFVLKELKKIYKFIPLFLSPIFLNSEKRIERVFLIITFAILYNCEKIFLYLKSINFKLNGYTYDGIGELGFTSHAMAGLSFVTLGLILIFFIEKKKIKLFVSSILYIIILFFVLIGQRRGAYLGVLIPLVIILCVNLNRKILIYGTIIIILSSLSLKTDYIKNNVYYKRFISIKDIKESSPAIRIILWKASLEMFKEKPIIGYSEEGIKNGYLEYIEKNKDELLKILPSLKGIKNIANQRNPHNMYMRSIVDMGILGVYLIALILKFIYENFKMILILRKEKNKKYIISIVSFSVMLSFMIISLTESVWETNNLKESLIFGIIIFFSVKRLENKKVGSEE